MSWEWGPGDPSDDSDSGSNFLGVPPARTAVESANTWAPQVLLESAYGGGKPADPPGADLPWDASTDWGSSGEDEGYDSFATVSEVGSEHGSLSPSERSSSSEDGEEDARSIGGLEYLLRGIHAIKTTSVSPVSGLTYDIRVPRSRYGYFDGIEQNNPAASMYGAMPTTGGREQGESSAAAGGREASMYGGLPTATAMPAREVNPLRKLPLLVISRPFLIDCLWLQYISVPAVVVARPTQPAVQAYAADPHSMPLVASQNLQAETAGQHQPVWDFSSATPPPMLASLPQQVVPENLKCMPTSAARPDQPIARMGVYTGPPSAEKAPAAQPQPPQPHAAQAAATLTKCCGGSAQPQAPDSFAEPETCPFCTVNDGGKTRQRRMLKRERKSKFACTPLRPQCRIHQSSGA